MTELEFLVNGESTENNSENNIDNINNVNERRPQSIEIESRTSTDSSIDTSPGSGMKNLSTPESGYVDVDDDIVADDNDSDTVVTLIHFNDCYNVEPTQGASSGAAGFLTAINQHRHLNPIILFSGDIISPSFISTFTKGEQMIPVLNDIKVDCAVFGNHEFDYGVDNLISFAKQTTFPWLLSNVIDKETSSQLGEGKIYEIIERNGIKFGLIGLIEEEWLNTLSTIGPSDVIYSDFCSEGRRLAMWLKQEHQVDYVIALTHMRTPNDLKLADQVPEIDLILGGHDHVYEIIKRSNGSCIIKSGTDFREFSKIELHFTRHPTAHITSNASINSIGSNIHSTSGNETHDNMAIGSNRLNQDTVIVNENQEKKIQGQEVKCIDMKCERIYTLNYDEEPELKKKLEKFQTSINDKMNHVLGQFNCDLDGTFSSIRTRETNLGNFVCDIMLASTHADVAILNSGTLRSDRIHQKGDFTMRDLFNILGYIDPIAVLLASGYQIWKALENGVSQWPKLEGRFPQISGASFAFDPRKPPGQRIDPASITIGYESLDLNRKYRLTTKAYLASGKDGYDILKECPVLVPGDESPDLTTSILNHFEAIRIFKSKRRTHHRQSLVCISHSSLVKMLEDIGQDQSSTPNQNNSSNDASDTNSKSPPKYEQRTNPGLPPIGMVSPINPGPASLKRPRKAMSIDQMEFEQAKLEPKIEGRIRLVDDYVS